MGSEELKKRRKTHEKYIDKKRVELSTPELFTKIPKDQPRCALATIMAGTSLTQGERLIIETLDGGMIARRGQSVVARFQEPPADLLQAISSSKAGLAAGVVQRVNSLSNTAEVSIR